MKFNALLDVNVVAHETTGEVAVLLDLQAPPSAAERTREPSTLQVVLDRSGSMSGPPLEGAKQALIALVHRLEPTDNFGLVTFDDQAQVVVPAGPLTDKPRVIALISAIVSGGCTDLGAGYLRGLREVRRVSTSSTNGGNGGATVLVVSDGHVNAGIKGADEFAPLGAKAYADRIVTSTLGYGRGYDESLLAALARAGAGNHAFADNPDEAGAKIAAEVDGLLDKVVQAATVTVQFPAHRRAAAALQRRPREPVPGDEAAGRIPDPIVHSEVLFQEAQQAKREASEAFERGDTDGGRSLLAQTRTMLGEAGLIAPSSAAESIQLELGEVELMQTMSLDAGASYMSKRTRESYHRQNRKRGRD